MKKIILYSGIILTVIFLWLAFKNTNYQHIKQAFVGARHWPIVPILLCLFAFYWLKAFRWRLILSPAYDLNVSQLAPAMMAGAAGNNLLPAHIGEFIRVYIAGTQLGIPKSTVFATLVVERFFDVITVFMIISIAFLLGDFTEEVYWVGGFLLFVAILTCVTSFTLITQQERWGLFLDHVLAFMPHKIRSKVASQVVHLATGMQSMQSRHLYLPVLLSSFLQWMFMALCIYFSLIAMHICISPYHSLIILGLTVAALILPTSPGFFGAIEYCFVLGLSTANVDPSVAVSAAIYYHLPMWIVVTLVGVFSVRRYGYSFKQLKSTKQ